MSTASIILIAVAIILILMGNKGYERIEEVGNSVAAIGGGVVVIGSVAGVTWLLHWFLTAFNYITTGLSGWVICFAVVIIGCILLHQYDG